MKTMPRLLVLLGLIALAGCANGPTTNLDDLNTTSHGLRYQQARQLALALHPGMTGAEVIALLGPPDQTGYQTFGSLTDRPWQGWVFDYHWPLGPVSANTLEIVLESDSDGGWKVNSWNWQ